MEKTMWVHPSKYAWNEVKNAEINFLRDLHFWGEFSNLFKVRWSIILTSEAMEAAEAVEATEASNGL